MGVTKCGISEGTFRALQRIPKKIGSKYLLSKESNEVDGEILSSVHLLAMHRYPTSYFSPMAAKSTLDPRTQPKLRFQVGQKVFCRVDKGWEPCTVIKQWWCEPDDEFYAEEVYFHPYQAIPHSRMRRRKKLRKSTLPYPGYPDGAIYVPSDTNDCVRRMPVNELDEVLLSIECHDDTEFIINELIYDRKIDVIDSENYFFCEKMAFAAVDYAHIGMLTWLSRKKVPLEHYRNDKGATLMHVAFQRGIVKVIQCVLGIFHPCAAINKEVDHRGYTALHYMVLYSGDHVFSHFDLRGRFGVLYDKEDHQGRSAMRIADALKRTVAINALKKWFSEQV